MASNRVRSIVNFDLVSVLVLSHAAHLERTCYQEQARVFQKVDVSHRTS